MPAFMFVPLSRGAANAPGTLQAPAGGGAAGGHAKSCRVLVRRSSMPERAQDAKWVAAVARVGPPWLAASALGCVDLAENVPQEAVRGSPVGRREHPGPDHAPPHQRAPEEGLPGWGIPLQLGGDVPRL